MRTPVAGSMAFDNFLKGPKIPKAELWPRDTLGECWEGEWENEGAQIRPR